MKESACGRKHGVFLRAGWPVDTPMVKPNEDAGAVSGVRTQLSATASPKARGESATAWRKRGKKAGMDEGPKEEGSRSGIETATAMALGEGGFVFAAAGGGEAGGDGA